MRNILRQAPLARESYWQTRRLLGLQPRNHSETLAALRTVREPANGAPRFIRLPWGECEYTTVGSLITQFEEIFVVRHYAFTPDGPEAPVIVDCGGNIGLSAIWFKQNYAECRLTVYEADPNLAELLHRNLERAALTDVAVHTKAVWKENGVVSFAMKGDDTGHIDPAATTTVAAVDLAAELPARVDLLKLDIEGAEFDVLNHLCDAGAISRVRRIVCECHVTAGTTDTLLSTLMRLRKAGMELSMRASFGPWVGLAQHASPFEAVGRNQMFMLLYAWRPDQLPSSAPTA